MVHALWLKIVLCLPGRKLEAVRLRHNGLDHMLDLRNLRFQHFIWEGDDEGFGQMVDTIAFYDIQLA